ncbi:uncharacterized protein LOC117805473 [Notolabrus celidotus]|uniref:uncharacterized protein LOC117805473 n=1 Tax=Notolabrus celidotus TaxID=1203425 RepID=UPI001490247E|nr:uncharacterized protein LOC117805473 [Notolabrus celidotus]
MRHTCMEESAFSGLPSHFQKFSFSFIAYAYKVMPCVMFLGTTRILQVPNVYSKTMEIEDLPSQHLDNSGLFLYVAASLLILTSGTGNIRVVALHHNTLRLLLMPSAVTPQGYDLPIPPPLIARLPRCTIKGGNQTKPYSGGLQQMSALTFKSSFFFFLMAPEQAGHNLGVWEDKTRRELERGGEGKQDARKKVVDGEGRE